MADENSIDQRVTLLEQATERHETRITSHGKEIDELRETVIREQAEVRHMNEQLTRIEEGQKTIVGQLNGILLQPAEKWKQLTMAIAVAFATGVVGIIVGSMFA